MPRAVILAVLLIACAPPPKVEPIRGFVQCFFVVDQAALLAGDDLPEFERMYLASTPMALVQAEIAEWRRLVDRYDDLRCIESAPGLE